MKGSVQVREIHSPSLEGNALGDPSRRATPVYLPPGYAEGTVRYPVVYFLHGFTGSGPSWVNVSAFSRTVPERVDALIEAGTVPAFIGVFVDGWTRLGGAQWENSEATGRYRDYLVRDVVGWADRELRTVPKAAARAVVGKSSGGYGALLMARSHPDVFGHVACHSGDAYFEYCYLPDFPKAAGAITKAGGLEAWLRDFTQRGLETKLNGEDHSAINMVAMSAAYSPRKGEPLNLELPFELETGRVRPEVWSRWLTRDPVRFIPKHIDSVKKLKSFFIDCGTRDEFNLRWGARMIAKELKDEGMECVHEEFEDGHMGINYRYDRSVAYLVPRLARE
jgi:S-formylglutathione hydrolase FrmB